MEPKYIVIEIQNGSIGGNNWAYDDRADAEVKFYQVLSEVVKSPIDIHTVMLVTDEGFTLDKKFYNHRPEPEPEPTPEATEADSEPVPDDSGTDAQPTEKVPADAVSDGEGA